MVDLRHRQLTGQPVDVVAEVSSIASSLQNVFYGQNPKFSASPWFSVRHLGVALVKRAGVEGDPADAVERVMLKMLGGSIGAYIQYESDKAGR